MDWHSALGNFRVWVSVNNIKCKIVRNAPQFSFDATAHLEDTYDWDVGSDNPGGIGLRDKHLAMLHRYGAARQFEIRGNYTEHDQWRKGEKRVYDAKYYVERARIRTLNAISRNALTPGGDDDGPFKMPTKKH